MLKSVERLRLIDTIRGITAISMIIYHLCWDLANFNLGITHDILRTTPAYIWQQTICWSFIFLAGFSFNLGKHHLKRGLMALGSGMLISLVTYFFMYEQRDIFGVLWLIGISILIAIPLDKLFVKNRKNAIIGLIIAGLLFFVTRNINYGNLGFEGLTICELPKVLYSGYAMTFLGFIDPNFFSSDYFSIMPWFFLFISGYFLYHIISGSNFEKKILTRGIFLFEIPGRYSLYIYIFHQILLYGIVWGIYILLFS